LNKYITDYNVILQEKRRLRKLEEMIINKIIKLKKKKRKENPIV